MKTLTTKKGTTYEISDTRWEEILAEAQHQTRRNNQTPEQWAVCQALTEVTLREDRQYRLSLEAAPTDDQIIARALEIAEDTLFLRHLKENCHYDYHRLLHRMEMGVLLSAGQERDIERARARAREELSQLSSEDLEKMKAIARKTLTLQADYLKNRLGITETE